MAASREWIPYHDPRPDLTVDHDLWKILLWRAWQYDGHIGPGEDGLFWILEGVRCLGAHLEPAGDAIRLSAGDIDETEYRKMRRQYLAPHGEALVALLRALAQPAPVPEHYEPAELDPAWTALAEGAKK